MKETEEMFSSRNVTFSETGLVRRCAAGESIGTEDLNEATVSSALRRLDGDGFVRVVNGLWVQGASNSDAAAPSKRSGIRG